VYELVRRIFFEAHLLPQTLFIRFAFAPHSKHGGIYTHPLFRKTPISFLFHHPKILALKEKR
jgi:hypothetical protein